MGLAWDCVKSALDAPIYHYCGMDEGREGGGGGGGDKWALPGPFLNIEENCSNLAKKFHDSGGKCHIRMHLWVNLLLEIQF